MIDAQKLLPPETGPKSDPVLYGVAEALARVYPIDERHFPKRARAVVATASEPQRVVGDCLLDEVAPT